MWLILDPKGQKENRASGPLLLRICHDLSAFERGHPTRSRSRNSNCQKQRYPCLFHFQKQVYILQISFIQNFKSIHPNLVLVIDYSLLITSQLFHRLIKDGVKVYEYPEKFLHGKAFLFDDKELSLGSFNLDGWSFFQNTGKRYLE